MKLNSIDEIKKEGLTVFMPSGIQATLFIEGKDVIVKYYNLQEDKYSSEDFKKLINEGIFIFNDRPTTQVIESLSDIKLDKDGYPKNVYFIYYGDDLLVNEKTGLYFKFFDFEDAVTAMDKYCAENDLDRTNIDINEVPFEYDSDIFAWEQYKEEHADIKENLNEELAVGTVFSDTNGEVHTVDDIKYDGNIVIYLCDTDSEGFSTEIADSRVAEILQDAEYNPEDYEETEWTTEYCVCLNDGTEEWFGNKDIADDYFKEHKAEVEDYYSKDFDQDGNEGDVVIIYRNDNSNVNESEEEDLSVESNLRKSASEEEEAIAAYLKRAKKSLKHGNEKLYKLYKELADDEKVHAAQLKTTIDSLGFNNSEKELEGKEEAQELLKENNSDFILRKESKLNKIKSFKEVNEFGENTLETFFGLNEGDFKNRTELIKHIEDNTDFKVISSDDYSLTVVDETNNGDNIVINLEHKLKEAFQQKDCPQGTVYKGLKAKDKEYITPEFKMELLIELDRIAREYPDVHVRQQANTFMDEVGLQEYYDTKAVLSFVKDHIDLLNKHVNESVNENDTLKTFLSDYFYDNAELQSEINYDSLEHNKDKIYAKWQELTADGENKYKAAEIAYNEIVKEKVAESEDETTYIMCKGQTVDLKGKGEWVDDDTFYLRLPEKDLLTDDDGTKFFLNCEYLADLEQYAIDATFVDEEENAIEALPLDKQNSYLTMNDKELIMSYLKKLMDNTITESINEDAKTKQPYENIADDLMQGAKQGYEPIKLGNWLCKTSLDNKWESFSPLFKDYILKEISYQVNVGDLEFEDLEISIDGDDCERAGLDAEDIKALEMFDDEEIEDMIINEFKPLTFLISYSIEFDNKIEYEKNESVKSETTPKKSLTEMDAEDTFYMYKEKIASDLRNGCWGGYTPNWDLVNCTIDGVDVKALGNTLSDSILSCISYPVEDGYDSYIGVEYLIEHESFDEEDREYIEFDLKENLGMSDDDIKKLFTDEDASFSFYVNYEISIEPEEDEYDEEDIDEQFKLKDKKKKKKKLTELDKKKVGKNMKKVNESAYRVYNNIEGKECGTFNSWNDVENFLNKEWGSYSATMAKENPKFGTEEDKDNFYGNYDLAVVQLPIAVEETPAEVPTEEIIAEVPAETPVEVTVELEPETCTVCNCNPCTCETETTECPDCETEQEPKEEKPEETTEVEVELEIPTEDIESIIAGLLDEPDICPECEQEECVCETEEVNEMCMEKLPHPNPNEEKKEEDKKDKDEVKEDFKDNMGMLTDINDLDFPDALQQAVDTKEDGSLYRISDIGKMVQELKTQFQQEIEDFKNEMRTEIKTALGDLKQDIKSDVKDIQTDVTSKLDNTNSKIADLTSEEGLDDEEFEDEELDLENEEPTDEETPAEEETEDNTEELEEAEMKAVVKDYIKNNGAIYEQIKNVIRTSELDGKKMSIQTVAEKLREDYGVNTRVAGIYDNVSLICEYTPIKKYIIDETVEKEMLKTKNLGIANKYIKTGLDKVWEENRNKEKYANLKSVLQAQQENVDDAKKAVDKYTSQGEEGKKKIKAAAELLTDNEQDKEEVIDYAIDKMTETKSSDDLLRNLLGTSRTAEFGNMNAGIGLMNMPKASLHSFKK